MDLNNQEIKTSNLDSSNSKAKRVYDIFASNPNVVFDVPFMTKSYNKIYTDKITNHRTSNIITRLYAKNKLSRTPTQLNLGYIYTISNKEKLEEIYNNYLVPLELENKDKIKDLILKNNFGKLETNHKLDLNEINSSDFVKKYGLDYFYSSEVLKFLATNFGFLLCDGHIRKNLQEIQYYFNQKKDAELFIKDFNLIFRYEKLSLKYHSYCFRVGICNKGLAKLFNYFGVPTGNKVFKPFLIPDWIYNGIDDIKSAFLSIIYGSEGCKPQDNKHRIGFVISKQKEYVENLLTFSNQIRAMLYYFGITTSHIQLRKQKRRNFCVRFYIKGKDNLLKFYNKIGFAYASEKQEELESLLRRGKLIN